LNFSFGDGDDVELDLSDCTFESFLRCFAQTIGKVRNYCAHLSPLPVCEKRFRTSFCKNRKQLKFNCFYIFLVPTGLDIGVFNAVSGAVEYAPGMNFKDIGFANLPGAV
jgi:hypothetical protein